MAAATQSSTNCTDLAGFAESLETHRPRLYITNSALHNPTGATLVADFNIASWQDLVWGQGIIDDFMVPREVLA